MHVSVHASTKKTAAAKTRRRGRTPETNKALEPLVITHGKQNLARSRNVSLRRVTPSILKQTVVAVASDATKTQRIDFHTAKTILKLIVEYGGGMDVTGDATID